MVEKKSLTHRTLTFLGAEMKRKVLVLSMHYPFAISSYFLKALKNREDVDLKTCGQHTGTWIPWRGGMNLPAKYDNRPDIVLGGVNMLNKPIAYSLVSAQLGDWKPDLILNIDAGTHWEAKPDAGCPVATVATDPHVLGYQVPRGYSDFFFNMQKYYSENKDIYLPYAYSTYDHYREQGEPYIYDASLIGLQYPQRIELVNSLRNWGNNVYFENGDVFDEARKIYSQTRVGISWSSMRDLIARVFEFMAFGVVPVINRVPDLPLHFKEDVHYLGFDTVPEAVEKVKFALENPEFSDTMVTNALQAVKPHTYDARVQQIFDTVFGE
jgi:hypothetical protein